MRRVVVSLFALVSVLAAPIVPAHAWGSATHAYIADRLGGAPLVDLVLQRGPDRCRRQRARAVARVHAGPLNVLHDAPDDGEFTI